MDNRTVSRTTLEGFHIEERAHGWELCVHRSGHTYTMPAGPDAATARSVLHDFAYAISMGVGR